MKTRYTFVEGKPILMPVVWLIRAVKGILSDTKKGAMTVRNITNATNESDAQYKLFCKIGLANPPNSKKE